MGRKVLLLDLDGVLLGMTGYHKRNIRDLSDALFILEKWQKGGGKIIITTNRPPSEMQPIAYLLNIKEGYWITENGGSYYNVAVGSATASIHWARYADEYVPKLRQYLKGKVEFHPSNSLIRTMIIAPTSTEIHQFASEKIMPLMTGYKDSELFELRISKIVSIEPKKLSKEVCFEEFITLNRLDFEKDAFFFIADSARDIGIAQKLSKANSQIGAVGNSSYKFASYVRGIQNGICAPASTSHHASLVHLLQCFMDNE